MPFIPGARISRFLKFLNFSFVIAVNHFVQRHQNAESSGEAISLVSQWSFLKLVQKDSISYIQSMLVHLALCQLAFTSSILTKPKKEAITFCRRYLMKQSTACLQKKLLVFEQTAFQSVQKHSSKHVYRVFFSISFRATKKINNWV